jgi:6-pyruvoyltetrahydropterin/6-carboxytetrahydropterin synthase
MPYRICKSFEIESGHLLAKHPGKCRFPHGHSRRVEFVLEADALDPSEMVCDFKAVKELIEGQIEAFDHALCMNADDPKYADFKAAYGDRVIGFEGQDPTTEVMAKTFFDLLANAVAAGAAPGGRYPIRECVRVVSVRVWETSSSWAEYLA